MKTKGKKLCIAGLHLWLVKRIGGSDGGLWVTTATYSPEAAMSKAVACWVKQGIFFPKIKLLRNRGTLDC